LRPVGLLGLAQLQKVDLRLHAGDCLLLRGRGARVVLLRAPGQSGGGGDARHERRRHDCCRSGAKATHLRPTSARPRGPTQPWPCSLLTLPASTGYLPPYSATAFWLAASVCRFVSSSLVLPRVVWVAARRCLVASSLVLVE